MRQYVIAGLFLALLAGLFVPGAYARQGSDDSGDGSRGEIEIETEIEVEDGVTTNTTVVKQRGEILEVRGDWRNESARIREERKGDFDDLRERMRNTTGNLTNLTKEQRDRLRDQIRDEREQILEDAKGAREALREQTKLRIEQAREELKAQQERIKELRKNYSENRDGFRDAREKERKACTGSQRSEECKKARQELSGDAKQFMGGAAEEMQRIISSMRLRVETNPNIDNETKADVTARLDAHTSAISAAQAKVSSLSNSTDMNATRQAAEELRAAWMDARVSIRLTEGLLVHARFDEFLDHLESMEARFKEARDELATNGTDVTQLDADMASFSAKIDAARADYAQVQASYIAAMDTAKTEAEANQLLKSTRDQIKETRDGLQGAREDLRNIVKDFRAIGGEKLQSIAAKIKADSEANASLEVEA